MVYASFFLVLKNTSTTITIRINNKISLQLKLRKLERARSPTILKPTSDPNRKLLLKRAIWLSWFLRFLILNLKDTTVIRADTMTKALINQKVTPAGPSLVGLVVKSDSTKSTAVIIRTADIATKYTVARFFIRYNILSHSWFL